MENLPNLNTCSRQTPKIGTFLNARYLNNPLKSSSRLYPFTVPSGRYYTELSRQSRRGRWQHWAGAAARVGDTLPQSQLCELTRMSAEDAGRQRPRPQSGALYTACCSTQHSGLGQEHRRSSQSTPGSSLPGRNTAGAHGAELTEHATQPLVGQARNT